MKRLKRRNNLTTYGIPPIHPPGTEPAPPAIEPYPVAPNCERTCYRTPTDVNVRIGLLDPFFPQPLNGELCGEPGGPPCPPDGEYKWLCKWTCKGDELNPWKITLGAIEDLAGRVQSGADGLGSWIQQQLLPSIYETIIHPVKHNIDELVLSGRQWVTDELGLLDTIWGRIIEPVKLNLDGILGQIIDKMPDQGNWQGWITDTLIPEVKTAIEGLTLPEHPIRFLFPLWKP